MTPMPTKSSKTEEAGFSLVELLVVIVVIGILAAIAIVSVATAFDRAKQRGTMADMRTISKAIETYATDTGFYPANGQTMAQLATFLRPSATNVVPINDHWNHAYFYSSDNRTHYSIESYGKDGVDGINIDYNTRFQLDRDIIICDGMFTASPEN